MQAKPWREIMPLLGQLAGWPRLLADAFRLAITAVRRRFEWRTQFRFFLVLFFCTNMIVVYVMPAFGGAQ